MAASQDFLNVLNVISDIVIGLSRDYAIISFNDNASVFYHCEPQDAVGCNFFEFFASHGFRSPIDRRVTKNARKKETIIETHDKCGIACVLQWEILLSSDEASELHLLLIGKDISFKKNTLYESFMRIAPGSLYWKDKEGRYVGCNQFMVDTAGLASTRDIIGKTDVDLWPNYAKKICENDRKVIETGETLFTDEEVKIADGKLMYFAGVKTPLRNEKNEVIGVLCNSLDVTKLRITEQELRAAKEVAEESNRLKTQFILNMEHDIRTPFSGIYALIEMFAKRETDPERKKIFFAVSSAAKELLNYCNGILEFSKLESGGVPLLSKKFNLKKTIENVLTIEKPPAALKGLLLLSEYPDDMPTIFIGDPYRIQQILINLTSNAVKFTETGYIKITSSIVKPLNNNEVVVRVCVEDTGVGIEKDKQLCVYEKFNRLSHANKGVYKGSGLGLPIIKRLIEELGGEIDLQSELGRGTKFTFSIPLKKSLTDDLLFEDNQKMDMKSIKVLMVEDSEIAAIQGRFVLNECGFQSDLTRSKAEALMHIEKFTYDLILMDIGLEGDDGFAITQQIKENSSLNKETPVVALTAHSNEGDYKKRATDVGMIDFITKPLTEQKILALLLHNKILQQKICR